MHSVQAEAKEGLRQPVGSVGGTDDRPALNAGTRVVNGVDRVHGMMSSEFSNLVVPGGGIGAVSVEQHDRYPGLPPAAVGPGGALIL